MGQIGSLVRIPQGLVDLIGTVTLLGIAELSGSLEPTETVQKDERWLQIQLLGEINRGTDRFQRGVANYPALDDPVHFVTADELAAVYPPEGDEHLRVGRLAAAENVPVCLDAARLVVRHCAVVGSSGSGKTSAVATLLQSFIRGGWLRSNILVIDPHGEYANALQANASVRSVLADPDRRLRVPYWALSSDDILRIFTGSPTVGATVGQRFAELVTEARRSFAEAATWLTLDSAAITSDTPVPFNIREVWYKLDSENRETRDNKADPATACLIDAGDPATLRSARFKPYGPAGQAPHKSPTYNTYVTTPDLLRLGLLDPRLQFFQEPIGDPQGADPLVGVIKEWLGEDKPISVLDFNGVADAAADLAIGVVMNLVFEVAARSELGGLGIGRPNPVLIVLEEAHRYLGETASPITRDSANRIAREGRKYGVGLLLVTQRPTELPDTVLAQCGTIIALRLSNSVDQGAIRSALPDTVSGLASVLPSLRTGEAIISGEALILPSRVLIDRPYPAPKADDPSLAPWKQPTTQVDPTHALGAWRGTIGGMS